MKKMTVTVAIPAHNEEANIAGLLLSIVRQKQDLFQLDHVWVVCDGTTDHTAEIVNKLSKKFPVITVKNDKKRYGKLKRLEQIYKENNSDIVCVFDGDVMLGKATVLEDMIKHFSDKNVFLVGGNNQPVAATTFIGTLINMWSYVWYLSRFAYNGGDNIHNIRGCALAYKKIFANKIHFPDVLASESQYVYIFSKREKGKFIFEVNATVYYRKPLTLADYLSQFKRSTPESDKLQKIFGTSIKRYYKIPRKYSFLALGRSLVAHPFLTIASGIFVLTVNKLPSKTSMIGTGIWKPVQSTKTGIPVPF